MHKTNHSFVLKFKNCHFTIFLIEDFIKEIKHTQQSISILHGAHGSFKKNYSNCTIYRLNNYQNSCNHSNIQSPKHILLIIILVIKY